MRIVKEAIAGTLESSDLLVSVSPRKDGELRIIVQSEVMKQFGKQIRLVVKKTLERINIEEGTIVINDKGALDCVIRARVQAAVMRGASCEDLNWEGLS